MEFSLTTMDGLSSADRVVGMFVFIALLYVLLGAGSLLIQRRRMKTWVGQLIRPILAQLNEGKWNPAKLTWDELSDPMLKTMSEIWHLELSRSGPLTAIDSLRHIVAILTQSFERRTRRLQMMGVGSWALGLLGILMNFLNYSRCVIITGSTGFPSAFFAGMVESFFLVAVSIAVGTACIWIAALRRGLVRVLGQEISTRLLAHSAQKK